MKKWVCKKPCFAKNRLWARGDVLSTLDGEPGPGVHFEELKAAPGSVKKSFEGDGKGGIAPIDGGAPDTLSQVQKVIDDQVPDKVKPEVVQGVKDVKDVKGTPAAEDDQGFLD